MRSQRTPWSEAEKELLRQLYAESPQKELIRLFGRSAKALRAAAAKLGVRKLHRSVSGPKNWRPIGAERMDRGHRIRKVTDTGNPKRDWKRVEVLEWEAVHGLIPPGHQLMVLDASRPRTMSNLGLFTPQQHFNRANVRNLPPEVQQLCQLKGQITQQVNRLVKQRAEPLPPSGSTC